MDDYDAIAAQLRKKGHVNILPPGGQFEAETLAACLVRGITESDFADYLEQLCDALEFLQACKPPILYLDITPEKLLIGEDNILKLTGFESASYGEDKVAVVEAFGLFVDSMDAVFKRRYKRVIRGCTRQFETLGEIRRAMGSQSGPLIARYAILIVGIALVTRIMTHVLGRFF